MLAERSNALPRVPSLPGVLTGYGSPGSPDYPWFRPHYGSSLARRLRACHPCPKARARTADVHQVIRKWRHAISWFAGVDRRVVGPMDKIRALIVDDSSVMRKIVERSLRQAGIELEKVVEASNGAEALTALHNNVVDLILCDINMPVMDGLEFVRAVAT